MQDWKTFWKELGWEAKEAPDDAAMQRLKQRAAQYARQPQADDVAERYTVLAFILGQERYAVDVMLVRNMRHIENATAVPGTPAFYPGVVNLRGKIITVMDLRLFFNMPADDLPNELVVVQSNQLEIGLLAHRIEGVMEIPSQSIQVVHDIPYAYGITTDQLILLDVVHLFQDERLILGGGNE
ncbi:MAG: purine-binding chemotaxis protein CheW [Chloroflexi bacterium]|nr:MAG: purine-binding chemotaxis protein CheW [Chloroflexota bacterium]